MLIIMKNFHKHYDVDETKYIFNKENGIYSKRFKRFIGGCPSGGGYLQTRLRCKDGKYHLIYLHIALWEHFNGKIPDGYEINHKDENKFNNSLSNLELLTRHENIMYGSCQERRIESRKRPVLLVKKNKIIKRYGSKGECKKDFPDLNKYLENKTKMFGLEFVLEKDYLKTNDTRFL